MDRCDNRWTSTTDGASVALLHRSRNDVRRLAILQCLEPYVPAGSRLGNGQVPDEISLAVRHRGTRGPLCCSDIKDDVQLRNGGGSIANEAVGQPCHAVRIAVCKRRLKSETPAVLKKAV